MIGRTLIAVIPMVSGLFKIGGYSQIVGFAAAKGLPVANVAIACAAAVELLGGIAILLGFKARDRGLGAFFVSDSDDGWFSMTFGRCKGWNNKTT